MALEHLITRRRAVRVGGLPYVCRGPTVATVHLVLVLYAPEVLAARGECDGTVDVALLVAASVRTCALQNDPRVRRVLETCVDGDLEAAVPSSLAQLAEVCLSLCDPRAIVGSIDIPEGFELDDSPDVDEEEVSGQSITVVRMAQRHACSPGEVMDWPYETMQEALAVEQECTKQGGNGVEPHPGSHSGIGVSSARTYQE